MYKLFQDKTVALLSSILFAIHPIQTEAISYASGMGDPLSMVLMLTTILLSFSTKKRYLLLSFITCTLALLSKEITLILPFLILLAHVFYTKKYDTKSLLISVRKIVPYIGIIVFYFFLRLTILNFQNTLNFYNGDNIYTQNVLIRLNTFLNLIPHYIALLLYPHTLFIERPGVIFSTITFSTILVIFFSIILFALGIRYINKYPSILFSFLCFWIYSFCIPLNKRTPSGNSRNSSLFSYV